MYELFQALVGAVLPDYDHYDDASLLNRLASHAAHATTRVFDTQGNHKSGCTYQGTVRVSEFVVDHSYRAAQPLSILTCDIDFLEITAKRNLLLESTSCQLFLFAGIANILGQYSTDIPAQRKLAHKLSARQRSLFSL